MEKNWLTVPADRKPIRTVRLCILLGLTVLTLIVAAAGQEASGTQAEPLALAAPNG